MESHLQSLIAYFSAHPHLALAAIFLASALEAVAIVGAAIPGSTIVFAGGVLVGLQALDPRWATASAVAGAVLGDGLSYWLGYRYRERILGVWPFSRYPGLFQRGHAYFEKHGGKSVFLGRFLAPVRSIVPVVAGMSNMPPVRFYVLNVLSALAWSAAHILPGVLFGASLQLAGAVSSRLLVLGLAILVLLWAVGKLFRWALRYGEVHLIALRDRAVEEARGRTGFLARAVLSFFDPSRPESRTLLGAAALLIGGAWVFVGTLEDVVSNDPLVGLDRTLHGLMQSVRTGWVDGFMVVVTALGGAAVTVVVVAAVAGLLLLARRWRTLGYWLAAAGFAEVLVFVLKHAVGRSRPGNAYYGMEPYSFPSGHAALAITVYGFLAFLLARGKSAGARTAIALSASSWIALIAFSRLYLGVHWFSDVVASLGLGLAWVALLAIAYTHHVRDEQVNPWTLSLVVAATLAVMSGTYVQQRYDSDLATYGYRPATETIAFGSWVATKWRDLPAARSELAGEAEEPFSIQWAGTSEQVAATLLAAGWEAPRPWASKAALLWLLPAAPIEQLPVLPKFDQGERQELSFVKVLGPRERAVIRLWRWRGAITGAPFHATLPLWYGTATLEELRRPGGLVTVAATRADFAAADRLVEEDVRKQRVPVERRKRDKVALLLLW